MGCPPEEGPPGGAQSVRRVSPEPSLRLEPSRCSLASWRRGQRVMPWRRHARFSVVGHIFRFAAASRRPTPNCACMSPSHCWASPCAALLLWSSRRGRLIFLLFMEMP